jgi:hypothetical protein
MKASHSRMVLFVGSLSLPLIYSEMIDWANRQDSAIRDLAKAGTRTFFPPAGATHSTSAKLARWNIRFALNADRMSAIH